MGSKMILVSKRSFSYLKFIICICFFSFTLSIGNNSYSNSISDDLLLVYKRSMIKWNVDYDSLTNNKAGAACIVWDLVNDDFLKNGIFTALGYSWQIETREYAVKIAMDGCKRMRSNQKIEDKCECKPIIYNNSIMLEKN